jgi:two-component system, sensor histidine kinase and response regulator
MVCTMGGLTSANTPSGEGEEMSLGKLTLELEEEGTTGPTMCVEAISRVSVVTAVEERRAIADDKLSVLVVDDEPAGRRALHALLAPLDQDVVLASSGREALRHLLDRDFAVILLDVQMPTMDGFETARLIRERDRTRHVPIIFLTAGQGLESQVFRGYALGAVDYLLKPIEPEILRSKVSVFVDLARKTRLIEEQAAKLLGREQEARRLLDELAQRNRDLEASNRELESFSHTVSHDLRAPLRGLDGFSRALLEDHASALQGEGQVYVTRIRDSALHMAQLVEGLVVLSTLTRHELIMQDVDLTELAQLIMRNLHASAPERAAEVRIAPRLQARGDPRLLRIVLENLLGNAWKFTSKREVARVELGVGAHEGHEAFFIRDNGAGFDMAHAHRLYTAFQRLHSARDFEGTGIGLASVHRILRRHGGRIWSQSRPGEGTTFHFVVSTQEAT